MALSTTPNHRLFHSFCTYPTLRFDTQAPDETVVLILRQHPITQLPWILASIVLFVLPVIFNIFLPNFFDTTQIFFINFFWYTGLFIYIFLNILSWTFNVGIVTNRRVIDVDFSSFLYKEVTATIIEKIEDVTTKTGGFIPSIFDYGNVFIKTAANEENIEFVNVPFPTEAATIINNLMDAAHGS